MNTTKAWRLRGVLTRRCGFGCPSCGRIAIVRRRRCVCGASPGEFRALPRAGVAEAVTRAGTSLERLDQVRHRCVAVVLRIASSRLACLIADTDAALCDKLRGQPLRLAIRAIGRQSAERNEPLRYGLKAAADLQTRRILLASRSTPREAQND